MGIGEFIVFGLIAFNLALIADQLRRIARCLEGKK